MIYSLVLQAAYAEKRLPGRVTMRKEPSEKLNLLRTCSQASEEAAQVLYQENIFRFAAHPMMDSALLYQKTVDALQNVRLVMDLSLYDHYSKYEGPLVQLQRLNKSGTIRKSCNIELKCTSWTPPHLKIKLIDLMKASFSTVRVVRIELDHSYVCFKSEAEWNLDRSKPDHLLYKNTCEYRAEWVEQRTFVYENPRERLGVEPGEGSLEITGVSQVLVFRPRGNSHTRVDLRMNRAER